MRRLSGKTALITGAGQGVGLGIARGFAQEGANLVITGRDEQKLRSVLPGLEALGAEVVVCPGDAAVRANAQKAVHAVDAFAHAQRCARMGPVRHPRQRDLPGGDDRGRQGLF